ncbi:MAG: DegT/DnrJ/EryC1/StrS family aminotransferase, partial [Aliarcobacter sp.]|nr:DegT/DnrJ/EryC1/StrS family aminotransferase [Aliarcobacter sp.]
IQTLDFDFKSIISHIFVVKTTKRDELREFLLSKNIECGIHYKPNHLLTKYKSDALPITEKVYEEILTLPCQLDLVKEERDFVINSIKEFFNA